MQLAGVDRGLHQHFLGSRQPLAMFSYLKLKGEAVGVWWPLHRRRCGACSSARTTIPMAPSVRASITRKPAVIIRLPAR
ncbi:hypothetical protein ACRBEV_04270 [Methylobacterium phyllosphaerae]